ncbi:MAG: transglutaminase family protein, partial [Candidatus Lindowbacteria bacterium]|nr:transglutaminase family protein [Candidatus Lindowbacteria bacterium]
VAVGRDYSDTAPVNGIYLGAESADVETIVKMELSEV